MTGFVKRDLDLGDVVNLWLDEVLDLATISFQKLRHPTSSG
jgi:hypothetical protein